MRNDANVLNSTTSKTNLLLGGGPRGEGPKHRRRIILLSFYPLMLFKNFLMYLNYLYYLINQKALVQSVNKYLQGTYSMLG